MFGTSLVVHFCSSSQTKLTRLLILQYDAFEIGFITTDDFTNGDILEATYPAVAKRLFDDWMHDPAVPVVTGFLGKVLLNNSQSTDNQRLSFQCFCVLPNEYIQ